eukprot:jgi/Mesvir1/7462/Mv25815-RA.1
MADRLTMAIHSIRKGKRQLMPCRGGSSRVRSSLDRRPSWTSPAMDSEDLTCYR